MLPLRQREDGLSLVELLVAMTVLAIAMTIALAFYDYARQAFKTGENITEQQQVVRIAYDVLMSDIEMAGFNTNPDGNRDRPDEQIEVASPTAIVVRADFDATDPTERDVPEQTLSGAGSAFLSVTTGNDEIVGYALAKADGSSTDTLTFHADVGQTVRDGSVERIDIDGIALTFDDPPYTLYRITLDNDPSGCCSGEFIKRTPVMDNVRSMSFRYFDQAGSQVAAVGGIEDATSIATRGSIRRVAVEIEGLTRDPDLHWFDPDDPNPRTQDRRKFGLSSALTPPNLGMLAIPDLVADAGPPGPPSPPQLYPGHCGGLLIEWMPNPPEEEVSYYRVLYGLDPFDLTGQRTTPVPFLYLDGLEDGSAYHVVVRAVDQAGNSSLDSTMRSMTTANTNTPEEPLALTASSGLEGRVDLAWQAVVDNTGSTVGDPSSPLLRDLDGYYVYRDSVSFYATPSHIIARPDTVLDLPDPGFSDNTVVNCKQYWYYVAAVDECGQPGPLSSEVSGQSWTDVKPKRPLNFEAFRAGTDLIRMHWSSVFEDVNGNPVHIGRYNVYRSEIIDDDGNEPTSFSLVTQVRDTTEFQDSVVIPPGKTTFFRVTATDVCAPPNESDPSNHSAPHCTFIGIPEFAKPGFNEPAFGPTSVEVEVREPRLTGTYEALHLMFTSLDTGATTTYDITTPGPSWTWTWNADPLADPPDFFTEGRWLVTATVDYRSGLDVCSASVSMPVIVDSNE